MFFSHAPAVVWRAVACARAQEQPPEDDGPPEVDLLKPQVELETGGHTAKVLKLFFTPDGKQVVTVSLDQTIRYWDVQTGQARRVLRPQCFLPEHGHAYAAALTADGRTLALLARSKDNDPPKGTRPIVLVNVEEERIDRILELPLFRGATKCLGFSPDSKLLVVGVYGAGADSVWDTTTGKKVLELKREGKELNTQAVAFAPDGKRLALSRTNRVYIVSVPSGELEGILDGLRNVETLAWAPDQPILALGDNKGVALWDAVTKKTLQTYCGWRRTA